MREKMNFNTEWLFLDKDIDCGTEIDINEKTFENITIPHANKILSLHKGPNFQEQIESYRFVSWYRKRFVIEKKYDGKRLWVKFEGIANAAEVYVNGVFVGEHKGAYTGFKFDITDYLNPCGAENIIAVKVDSTKRCDIPPEGGAVDYCLFGGIVRNVWLIVTDNCFIDNTYISTPEISQGNGRVINHSTIVNHLGIKQEICVETLVIDAVGKGLVSGKTYETLGAGDRKVICTETDDYYTPILWELDEPYLYRVITRLYIGNECIDEIADRIGYRWFEFKEDGFRLNGTAMKLVGINRHEQWPYLGRAVNDKYQRADADMIKNTGFNIVRCSHYPQAPSFLDRCDEIGLLVFEEAPGWQHIGDADWKMLYKKNIEEMIVRDRNHPSIISWGTRVNESYDDDELYKETNRIAKKLDSRPTHGVRRLETYKESSFLEEEDIYTINYQYPENPIHKPFVITEHSMDWYGGNGFSWASDERALRFTKSFAEVVDYYYGNKFCLGGFAWSMFDYNNEVNYTKTENVFYSGMYDIFRIAKMPAYFYMSQKKKAAPMVYIANYWTEQSPDIITVFSNCEEVGLYINGEFIDRIKPNLFMNLPHPIFEFKNVAFSAGELRAIGYIRNEEVCRQSRKTPGKAANLKLTPDYCCILADGADFTSIKIEIVDDEGTKLPYAENEVHISICGEGQFIGEEHLTLEGGSGAFFVKSIYRKTGVIQCKAESPGVKSDICEIKAVVNL